MESIHPLLVHFPIALLIASFGFECLAVFFHIEACRITARGCLLAGALGAGAAVLSGLQAEDVAKHTFEIHQVMQLHKQLGISVLIASALLSGGYLLTFRRNLSFYHPLHLLHLLALSAVVVALAFGAYLGGRLVYEFDVGKKITTSVNRY